MATLNDVYPHVDIHKSEERIELNEKKTEEPPVIDIVINNVVCSFNVRSHLNLRNIALNASNVEYHRENAMLTMKLRKPYTTASIWSSGKITCTGATSNETAKKAARRFARVLQKLGFNVKFANFRVVNVLGTCTMPFGIKILQFSTKHRGIASYEPELHPGVTYKIKEIKATMKIFSTGSITITAPSIENVQAAVEHIFPLVYEFRKDLYDGKGQITKPIKTKRNALQDKVIDDDEEDSEVQFPESDESWD